MAYFIVVFIGAIAGGVLMKEAAFIFGAVVGWLIIALNNQASRVNLLEEECRLINLKLRKFCGNERKKEDYTGEEVPIAGKETVFDWNEVVGPDCKPHKLHKDEIDDFIPRYTETEIVKPLHEWSPPSRPAVPEDASEPSAIEQAINSFFTGGNLLVKAGMAILFIGMSFLVKYAVQHGMFPIELRLAGAALGGVALLATGWVLRERRAEYALVLQGGGIGVLYLTTYGAMRLYHLIPALPAFIILVVISVHCGLLAVMQNARIMALFGISCGFVAPFLASVGTGDPAILFGYYTVLNIGIIGIAWFRSWRILNLVGFAGTFILSAIWGGAITSLPILLL